VSRKNKHIWQKGKPVIGKITEVILHSRTDGGEITPHYHYTYSVDPDDNKRHQDTFKGLPSQAAENSRIGQPLALLYLEDEPEANVFIADGIHPR
jgi:hypothetical protein